MRCPGLRNQRWTVTRFQLRIVFIQIVVIAFIILYLNLNANQQETNQPDVVVNRALLQTQTRSKPREKSSFVSLCPEDHQQLPDLVGRFKTKINKSLTVFQVATKINNLLPGGAWKPKNCFSRTRLAVIIPYRDREFHLTLLLSVLHPLLQRQMIDYRIFVIEQNGTNIFNKGKVMNAGFLEARKIYDFDCVVFHDVDVIPEDDRNLYVCPSQPKHMSPSISRHNYRLKYSTLVGGVLMFRAIHFTMVNGYSNLYPGWGGEDDDMANRILHTSLKITRPHPLSIGRYFVVEHQKRTINTARMKILKTALKRQNTDGLNSVHYSVVKQRHFKLYTHILVNVGIEPLKIECLQNLPRGLPIPTNKPLSPNTVNISHTTKKQNEIEMFKKGDWTWRKK